ncbi:MAG: hypothetical protein FWH32_03770 [Clostridiales bacterium]|nr:hypothetical protein [Clostridiales bacterium]
MTIDHTMLMASVSALIYLLLVVGVLILMRRKIDAAIDVFRSRHRLRPERGSGEPMFTGLDRLLRTTMRKPLSVTAFGVLTIVLFFTVFIASAKTIAPGPALATGAAFAGLPYLFLRVRLERLRRAGSFEGEKLVSAFLTAYLISGGNIYETIERAIQSSPHLKITAKLLSDLLIELRKTADPVRVRAATDAFAYGVGTNWASMLAYAIRTGTLKGTDMTPAIEDILSQLREARALAEARKRINGESVRMAAYLTPILYIGSVFTAIAVMGLPPGRLLYNQFFTAQGFALFTAGLFLFLLNRMLLETLTNRKLDF